MKARWLFFLLFTPVLVHAQDSLRVPGYMRIQASSGFVLDSVNAEPHLPGHRGFFVTLSGIKYPTAALSSGISGTATISLLLDTTGVFHLQDCTFSATIENSGLREDFKKSIVDAVAKLPRYIPAEKNGQKVAVLIPCPDVSFKIY